MTLSFLQKRIVVVMTAVVTLLTLIALLSAPIHAQEIKSSLYCGGDDIKIDSGCSKPDADKGSNKIETLLKTIINVFSAIVGSISVIMIIIGGFRYVTSAGDSNNVGAAKNTILYAVVGLIIVAFAQILVQFVLQRAT